MRSILDQKSRKASATGVVLSVSVVILLIAFLTIAFLQGWFSPAQKSVANNQVNQNNNPVNTNPNNGNIAKVGVTVYDISGTNLNTKVALPIYCQNNEGVMVADGTTSSTSAETSVTTTIGETLKCYAFNSTYQVKQAFTIAVNSEYQSLRIDAFKMPTSVKLQFYNNNQQTGQNLSGLGSDSAKATFDRIRITNNNSNTILPIGGFYLSLPQQSNVSDIVVPATATGSYSVKIAR